MLKSGKTKKLLMSFVMILMVMMVIIPTAFAQTIYQDKQWRVVYSASDGDQKGPHLHFQKGSGGKNYVSVYCMKLTNRFGETCDKKKSNPNAIPQWLRDKALDHSKVKPYIPQSLLRNVSTIRWLLVIGCAALTILAMLCPFDGPVGDAGAATLLLKALAY